MCPPTLNRLQSRRLDRRAMEEYGLSGLVLMENAGRGIADELCRLASVQPDSPPVASSTPPPARRRAAEGQLPPPIAPAARQTQSSFFDWGRDSPPSVLICCGKGNNAGDGFVVARHLDLRGCRVRVMLCAEPYELAGDAAANYRILQKTDVPIEILSGGGQMAQLQSRLAEATWIIDALLGTGARGEPRPPLDGIIDRLNAATAGRLAVDLPSGLDCDTGQAARHTVRAAVTCTFVAAKPGFFAPGAEQYTGRVRVLDIGTPRKLVREILAEG